MTLAWASPIIVDKDQNKDRTLTTLLQSSPQAWLSDSTNVMPAFDKQGNSTFKPGDKRSQDVVGVIDSGSFTSYFSGKDSPLLEKAKDDAKAADSADSGKDAAAGKTATADKKDEAPKVFSSVIDKSPESARIILVSSNDFLDDQILQLLGTANNGDYQNSMQFMANTIDWSLEDAGLLSISARGHFNRTLPPMEQGRQMFWEYLNYVLAALAIGVIAFLQRRRRQHKQADFARLVLN